jgi:hypothetical protein
LDNLSEVVSGWEETEERIKLDNLSEVVSGWEETEERLEIWGVDNRSEEVSNSELMVHGGA